MFPGDRHTRQPSRPLARGFGPTPPAGGAADPSARHGDRRRSRSRPRHSISCSCKGSRSLEQRLDLRFEALEHKLLAAFRGELQTALTAQGRQLAITLAGTAGALSALAFAAARLT